MIVLSFLCFVERLGSSMQLLSIENLSLAAEVTVVLLLLSFAWPQNKMDHVESSEGGESISWEPVKVLFLQNCTLRGLYLNQWRKNLLSSVAISPTKPFQLPSNQDDENATIPAPWQDRLTHLLNRQGFDAVLNAWQSVDSPHRGASCVSMIALSTYSDLTSAHGAMVTEQAIQRIGKQLSADMSHDSLIARYLPDRFVVLHFATTTAASRRAMTLFQATTLDDAFFQTAGKSLHLPSNISILGLESDSNVNSTMDLLEEGASECERSGRAILSREYHVWTETPVGFEPTPTEATACNPETRASSAGTKAKEAISSAEAAANQSNTEETQPASSDISAVASPDDIAALFAQINTQKSDAGSNAPSPTANTAKQPKSKVASNAPVADVGEAATDDDIAALFATVKPNVKLATPTAPAQSAESARPVEVAAVDSNEAASADDIAALFASVKPTPKTTNPPSPAAAIVQPSESAKPVAATVDPNEAASADDIAALFASVKPTNKTANITSPAANKAQPSEGAKPVEAAVDPNEVASADDIAALFATVKPTTKEASAAAPIATPTAPKAQPSDAAKPVVTAVDPNEAASADDIAALFAAVKPTSKTPGAPAPIPSKAAELSASERAESANADDIAALFATVKTAAQAAPATTKPAAQTLPASKEELSANASLDDIEALFAAMKK